MDTAGTAQVSDLMYKIINDASVTEPTLWLNPTTIGTYTFFIKGQSVSGQNVYKEIEMTVVEDCTP